MSAMSDVLADAFEEFESFADRLRQLEKFAAHFADPGPNPKLDGEVELSIIQRLEMLELARPADTENLMSYIDELRGELKVLRADVDRLFGVQEAPNAGGQ